MKTISLLLLFPLSLMSQKDKSNSWIGNQNRILNPGAELNSEGQPLYWKSDYVFGSESNWVSPYGVTSHEWNHGEKKLGLAPNSGNNYFRLTVTKHDETRKINLFQIIPLSDIQKRFLIDTIMAKFNFAVASNYNTKTNCSFTKVSLSFLDENGTSLDSINFKKIPSEFRDLDEGTTEAMERGFNVMHEFINQEKSVLVPKKTVSAKVEIYCEFPCNVNQNEENEEIESENSNTFFFDNFFLGFYVK
jgi:hypothetical protein